MKRQVVQDFLNLPGIVGIALMDRQSSPYFLGIDQILNVQQEEILAQGIQQVVATTPAGLQSFSFQFATYRVHIHKLTQRLSFTVLTKPDLTYQNYQSAFAPLKHLLLNDLNNGVETFHDWMNNAAQAHPSEASVEVDSSPAEQPTPPKQPTPPLVSTDRPALPHPQEAVDALNHLSTFTHHYLGKTMVGNTLKTSLPDVQWMQQFQVSRTGEIQWMPTPHDAKAGPLTPEQCKWIQSWVNTFVKKCSRIIRNYDVLLEKEHFSDRQRQLLFPPDQNK